MHRPEISDDLMRRLKAATEEEFTVPEHRVSFEDRVWVVLNELEEAKYETEDA